MLRGRLYTPERLREILMKYHARHLPTCAKVHISNVVKPKEEYAKVACTCGLDVLWSDTYES